MKATLQSCKKGIKPCEASRLPRATTLDLMSQTGNFLLNARIDSLLDKHVELLDLESIILRSENNGASCIFT